MSRETIWRERFACGLEEECLTALPDEPSDVAAAREQFMSNARRRAPSVSGSAGFFNPYGRVYVDIDHIEFASSECDDPYLLANVVERQHRLAAGAVADLRAKGLNFVLANNNHSGLLQQGCPVWGAHENYLVEKHPSQFTQLILPFLVTRTYAGAGGIRHPSGEFLAGVRPLCMESTTGGNTTGQRAIHSTSREEHHMGDMPGLYRYHQISADGHRSRFNIALQFGATFLALKAVMYDRQLPNILRRLSGFPPAGGDWVGMLNRLNVLAKPGKPLKINPLIVKTQRIYLDAACRYVKSMQTPPRWVEKTLQDWTETNDALERCDCSWLAGRLDSFAKYQVYSNVIQSEGESWRTLSRNPKLFHSLALLDHSYHEFCNPHSLFARLEKQGLLKHRVAGVTEPGGELEPYVPETATRARARARFVIGSQGRSTLMMDWSAVTDAERDRIRLLCDPFAQAYSPWEDSIRGRQRHSNRARLERLVQSLGGESD